MIRYSFRAPIWKYQGPGGWYFVTLPKATSLKIRKKHGISEEGWGRLRTVAKIGKSEWKTSIWYDSKAGGYLLPVKASVRKIEDLSEGSRVSVVIKLERNL